MMKLKGKVVLVTDRPRGTTVAADGGVTGYHPVGFIDLIAEMMKKKGS